MGAIFWLGIGTGALLSLAASIAANLLSSKINDYLDRRKLASQSNRYAKAQAFHHLIVELHSGKRDKYVYPIGSLSYSRRSRGGL